LTEVWSTRWWTILLRGSLGGHSQMSKNDVKQIR
jgi:hypothetical protein